MRFSEGTFLVSVVLLRVIHWNWSRIIKAFFISVNRLNVLNFSARMCVANTIQHGAFSAFIAIHITKSKQISARDFSLVHRMGESVMDKILKSVPFAEEEKLLLLISWFDKCTENVNSPTIFEETVARLIDHIDCTGFEGNFITSVLCKVDSNFSNSQLCRWAKYASLISKVHFAFTLYSA